MGEGRGGGGVVVDILAFTNLRNRLRTQNQDKVEQKRRQSVTIPSDNRLAYITIGISSIIFKLCRAFLFLKLL